MSKVNEIFNFKVTENAAIVLKKNVLIISITFLVSFFIIDSFSQDYVQDTLAVRAILDSNGLYTIPVDSVGDTSGGRIVNLSFIDMGLTKLPPEIGKLSSLTMLYFRENAITALPAEIGNLKSLKTLGIWLNHDCPVTLPPEFWGLTNLTDLRLSNVSLKILPPEIGNLTQLSSLWLTDNGLTGLPAEIGNLTLLDYLFVFGNNLTCIPPEIGNIINLETLEISHNNLINIPPEIGNLTNLLFLYMKDNTITSLPVEIGNLNYLICLDVTDNDLTGLPDEIGNLDSLKCLYCSDNHITGIPGSIIELTPVHDCSFGRNNLDTNTLSPEILAWLDKYDPDWRESQIVAIINNQEFNRSEFSIHIRNSSILYTVTLAGKVRLQIYNVKGRLLATPVDSYKNAGTYKVNWYSAGYGPGTYYFKFTSGNNSIVMKKIVVK